MTATAAHTSVPGTTPPLRRELEHFAQLDGVRAVAIALVLVQHLLPLHLLLRDLFPSLRGLPAHKVVPPLGFVGVSLFFVLSGFLITRILLAARDRADAGGATRGRQLLVFYGRRALRIFPVYYLTLLVIWLAGTAHIDDRIGWHALYLSNWLFSNEAVYKLGGPDRHFWSLAVEEQFYLVWPWLVLLLPRRLVPAALVATLLTGPAWRAWFELRGWPWMWTQFPTPANLDLLAAGGLLALVWETRLRRPLLWACLLVGLPTAGAVVGLYRSDLLLQWRVIAGPTALAALFVAVVGFAAAGIGGPGRLLAWRPVAYVGTISYGMYVVHTFVPPLIRPHVEGEWAVGVLALAATFALAALSWHLFEAPINRLKRRLPYT